ncbi:hypothetical protein GCM10022420_008450 [Streptomyces iranensis]
MLIAVDCPGAHTHPVPLACDAPPAHRLHVPVRAAQAADWDVYVILTPSAYRWLSEDAEG